MGRWGGRNTNKAPTRDIAMDAGYEGAKKTAARFLKYANGDRREALRSYEHSVKMGIIRANSDIVYEIKMGSTTSSDHEIAMDPPVSEPQRKAMYTAASGKSTLGIPRKVGEEFVGKPK